MERKAETQADEVRSRILDLMEEKEVDGPRWRKRSTTLGQPELAAIISFRDEFFDCIDFEDECAQDQACECAQHGGNECAQYQGSRHRANSAVPADASSWGNVGVRGGDQNSWDEADGTSFQVRGPTYSLDRKKVRSQSPLGELVVVDLFESEVDVERLATCGAAGTLQRIRASGESRRLLVLNFRVVPMHLVIVFALPAHGTEKDGAALDLLNRFVGGEMEDDERDGRLKVIPRVVRGPWVAKGLLGETPAVLGKTIPVQYFAGDGAFEVSIQCTASSIARRIVRVLRPASSMLTLELAFVIQGNGEGELPEQVLGSFRLTSPDVATLRNVSP